MNEIKMAVIGGTGVYDTGSPSRQERVQTEYGDVEMDIARVDEAEIAFLARLICLKLNRLWRATRRRYRNCFSQCQSCL